MKNIKCKCNGKFEEKTVKFEDFLMQTLKCSKCGKITFTPEQFKKVLALAGHRFPKRAN